MQDTPWPIILLLLAAMPTVIALSSKHRHFWAIITLNIFGAAGCTALAFTLTLALIDASTFLLLGCGSWLVALVWAVTAIEAPFSAVTPLPPRDLLQPLADLTDPQERALRQMQKRQSKG